jgi:quercetin dioxygenase-like cupin family protein
LASFGLTMEIFRFDEEVSIPISQLGSRYKIGPLTGPGSRVRVQIIYLGPGGLIGRHEAGERQLFAVVAGSGWVAGEGDRRDLRTGYAAVWEAGESIEAGSAEGLTRSASRETSMCGRWA